MSFSSVFGATTVVIGLATGFQPEQTEHAKAIAAIRKLGGAVEFVKGKPGQPLTITLTGTTSAAACMPHVKHILNVQCVDL